MSDAPELHPAIVKAQEGAIALLQPGAKHGRPAAKRAMFTDVTSFAREVKSGKPPVVLVSVAVPGAAVVLAIDANEFGRFPAIELAALMGVKEAPPMSAADRANMDYLAALAKKK